MEAKLSFSGSPVPIEVDLLARSIAAQQKPSGEIPWHAGGKTDPWDHLEAAIGLSIGGYFEEARRAFEWLASTQLEDGSWYSYYQGGEPIDRTRESNMTSYIAVAVFHYYLVTHDTSFLAYIWPTIDAAIDFAVSLQAPGGEIYWAKDSKDPTKIDPMALLTGSSSVYMSLKCALVMALVLGESRPDWQIAMKRLEDAIRFRPHLFNKSKARYSMDWFYPILTGALTDSEAVRRIDRYWNKFVVEGLGVRCVSDSPWVTMAETSELVMALAAMGRQNQAHELFGWIRRRCYDDGTYYCGFTFPDMVIWPDDRLTWTNAAVIMAADALYHISPASQLFNHRFWEMGKTSQTSMHTFFMKRHPTLNLQDAFGVGARNIRI